MGSQRVLRDVLILFVVTLGGRKEQGHRLSVLHGIFVSGVSDDNASVRDAEAYVNTDCHEESETSRALLVESEQRVQV